MLKLVKTPKKLKPLEEWYCDVCGEVINNKSEAYVIWQSDENLKSHNFKIIHQAKCDIDSFISSAALEDFLGTDGLIKLTSFLSLGKLKKSSHSQVSDLDEFVDFFRRVQIPNYEQARRNFSSSEVLELTSDANEIWPYLQENLIEIINTKITPN